MPELPDVTIYVERLRALLKGQPLLRVDLVSPFLLRTVEPSLDIFVGQAFVDAHRVGKRIVLAFDDDLFLVVHLMIAGRFHWRPIDAKVPGKVGLAALRFATGTLLLTEASPKKRASLHAVRGSASLAAFNRSGVEVLECSLDEFGWVLRSENHTLKRALTDPDLFSGIGNAYSDEILHRAGLSPVKLTRRLADSEVERLYLASRATLAEWIDRLRAEVGVGFPERVTAFRKDMAVHGRYGQPCPACGGPVQHIVYAENECNYCPACQTDGRLLADRSLSRLLRGDWPRSLEELEQRRQAARSTG